MPLYELLLVARPLAKAELIPAIKRTGEYILQSGGIIRKIEYLGCRDLPWKFFVHNEEFPRASYFVLHMNCSPSLMSQIFNNCKQDMDMIRSRFYEKRLAPPDITCTLEDELKPPAERPSVKALIELGKQKENERFVHGNRKKNPALPDV